MDQRWTKDLQAPVLGALVADSVRICNAPQDRPRPDALMASDRLTLSLELSTASSVHGHGPIRNGKTGRYAMASIRERPSRAREPRTGRRKPTKFEVRWFDPDTGDQLSRGGFSTRRDAQTFLQELNAAIVTGSYLDPRRAQITLAEFAERWIYAHPGKRRTIAGYRSHLRTHILATGMVPEDDTRPARSINLGALTLAELRPSTIRLWLRAIQAKTFDGHPLSPATVGQARRTLHCCLNSAVADEIISTNPVSVAKLPRSHTVSERRAFTREEYHALIAAFPARYRLAPIVMAYCGLRWGEVSALRLKHFDREKRLLRVEETLTEVGGKLAADTPKSAASTRIIPFPEAVYRALLDHLEIAFSGPDDYLFLTRSRSPTSYRTFRRFGWDPAIRARNLPLELTPHCLRHSYATWMLEAGTPIQTLRKLLGHASLITTQIYAHSTEEADRKATDRLATLIAG